MARLETRAGGEAKPLPSAFALELTSSFFGPGRDGLFAEGREPLVPHRLEPLRKPPSSGAR